MSCSSCWVGPLLAEALLVALAVSFACWLARANEPAYPLLARANDRLPQDDEQDRCHHARDHDVPNAGAFAEGPVGRFSRAAPGQSSLASKGCPTRPSASGSSAAVSPDSLEGSPLAPGSAAFDKALMQEAQFLRTKIVEGIREQAPGGRAFAPLAPTTLAIRQFRGFRGTRR